MKAVDDKVLKNAFVEVFNELNIDKSGFFKTLTENIEKVIKSSGDYKEIEKLESQINEKKIELKNLVKLQITGKLDNEEYLRILEELNKLRDTEAEFEKDEDRKEQLKRRVNEIIKVINDREELLEQFDNDIFNALIERIKVLG